MECFECDYWRQLANDVEDALYQALKICGDDALVSITKIPKEED